MTVDTMLRKTAFHVAIVGGGMCGLACAVYLSRAGINVDVFESASKFAEIGAGIWLGPNALRALDKMGLKDAIIAHADGGLPKLTPFTFISAAEGHQHIHSVTSYQKTRHWAFTGQYNVWNLSDIPFLKMIYRADFLDAVVGLIDPAIVHFNKRCTLISQENTSRPVIHFKDGTTFEADVVIGADGIKSAVRPAVIGKISEVPFDKWVTPASKEEILDIYSDCGTDVKKLITLVETCNKWCIHTVDPPLDSFVKGHIALVGDSAHGMCPHLGSGISQGLEDALVLCHLLAHPDTNLSNVREALQAYDLVRRSRANMVLRRSAWAGEIYESLPIDDNGTSQIVALRNDLSVLWEPVWHYDFHDDLVTAVDMLQENRLE
ncbi:hypothetical protein ID866_8322 [Astraeus odoratus]|nr:hypothetical protein ID866_8322 [Astraeus odoratus]